LGATGKIATILLLTLMGGTIVYYYYPETIEQGIASLGPQKTKVRITSNAKWLITMATQEIQGSQPRPFMQQGRGDKTYEIKGELLSITIEPLYTIGVSKPYLTLEILKGNKIVWSQSTSKGWIGWRSDIIEV